MAKDMMNNISRSDLKRSFIMFQTMVEEDSVSPSKTTESEQDNSFLGFQNCINICPHFAGEAFNLFNVTIPKTWVLLNNQSTLHLFCNPNNPWISNVRLGPGVMSIHCNSGISKTNTIADVADLDGDTASIHTSGVTKILSLYIISKRFRIKYYNHGSDGNTFIVHISPGNDIRFRQSKRGLY